MYSNVMGQVDCFRYTEYKYANPEPMFIHSQHYKITNSAHFMRIELSVSQIDNAIAFKIDIN